MFLTEVQAISVVVFTVTADRTGSVSISQLVFIRFGTVSNVIGAVVVYARYLRRVPCGFMFFVVDGYSFKFGADEGAGQRGSVTVLFAFAFTRSTARELSGVRGKFSKVRRRGHVRHEGIGTLQWTTHVQWGPTEVLTDVLFRPFGSIFAFRHVGTTVGIFRFGNVVPTVVHVSFVRYLGFFGRYGGLLTLFGDLHGDGDTTRQL